MNHRDLWSCWLQQFSLLFPVNFVQAPDEASGKYIRSKYLTFRMEDLITKHILCWNMFQCLILKAKNRSGKQNVMKLSRILGFLFYSHQFEIIMNRHAGRSLLHMTKSASIETSNWLHRMSMQKFVYKCCQLLLS